MSDDFAILATRHGQIRVDLALGNIAQLSFQFTHQSLPVLHRAHWVDDPKAELPAAMPFSEMRLSGDFLCAPFAAFALPDHPFHGPTANSRWEILGQDAGSIRLGLQSSIMGARVEKWLSLDDGPFLYQTHRFIGGQGDLPVSTHPMFAAGPGDRLSTSTKANAATPENPIVEGSHRLAYPARSPDIAAFPGIDGPVDLTSYPDETGKDDFIQLLEAPENEVGWTTLVRKNSIILVLKDARQLPITQLWISNGARTDKPWNGRHTGVIGIEDACLPFADSEGTGLHLVPDGIKTIRHAIGAIPRPEGWNQITDVEVSGNTLILTNQTGDTLGLPFAPTFFTAP